MPISPYTPFIESHVKLINSHEIVCHFNTLTSRGSGTKICELNNTSKRKAELRHSPFENRDMIIDEINKRLNELSSYESRLAQALKRNKTITSKLSETYDKIAESDMLIDRYQNLRTQYISDIHRLNFVIEGEINMDSNSMPTKCPFCEGEIERQQQESCASAAYVEINLIRAKLSDLEYAEESIGEEKSILQEQAVNLEKEKNDYLAYIESDLQPKVTALKRSLDAYEDALEEKNEFQFMAAQEERLIAKIQEIEAERDSRLIFRPKEYYDKYLLDDINSTLKEVIYQQPVNQIQNVYFSTKKFDIVANGKDKQTYGKGYRAFFNTVVGLTFMRLFSTQGVYSPGLFIVDSPILSLKEQGEEKASDSMKKQLFQYMANNQKYGQMIVIENEIPDIDYKDTNIIKFTKNVDEGRYGLLHGVKN